MNNNLVYSGTSDLIEDVDCIYMMDIEDENTDKSGLQTKHIKLTNQKLRGNNALELTYVYTKAESMPYLDMVNSVHNVDSDTYTREMILRSEEHNYNSYLNKHHDAISLIKNSLGRINMDKTELRDLLINNTDYGRDKCIEIIDKISGKLIGFKMGGKTGRKKVYFILTHT